MIYGLYLTLLLRPLKGFLPSIYLFFSKISPFLNLILRIRFSIFYLVTSGHQVGTIFKGTRSTKREVTKHFGCQCHLSTSSGHFKSKSQFVPTGGWDCAEKSRKNLRRFSDGRDFDEIYQQRNFSAENFCSWNEKVSWHLGILRYKFPLLRWHPIGICSSH